MYQEVIADVAKRYGLEVMKIGSAQKGYRNESYKLTLASGENVNLIFHKNEPEAARRIGSTDKASSALSDALPVRTRFDKRIVKLSDGKKDVYAGIYTYLPGTTIPWEAYTQNHIKLLGWAMSDMHAIWSNVDAVLDIYITDELRQVLSRMERYFGSPAIGEALARKLRLSISVNFSTYRSLLNQFDQALEPEEHILHMDLVRGNVLFGESSSPWQIDTLAITGIIDFEKAATGHRVFDIARTLAFLLVDCVAKDRTAIYKYFLQSGYNKRGKSSFQHKDIIVGLPGDKVLNTLVGFFLLHDFYKFLRHTPYESLESNHHFIRTRDILIDYGMLRLDKD